MITANGEWYIEFAPQYEKDSTHYKKLGRLPIVIHNPAVMEAVRECYKMHGYPEPYNPLRKMMLDKSY